MKRMLLPAAWLALSGFTNLQDTGGALPSGAYPDPLTGASADVTSSPASAIATSPGERWGMLWINRCTDGPSGGYCNGGNSYNLPELNLAFYGKMRFRFSDVDHADACTVAQLWRALGNPTGAVSVAQRAGLYALADGIDPKGYLDANGGTFLNVCYLQGDDFSTAIDGIVLDFEVADNRATQTVDMLMGALAAVTHGYGLPIWVYNNRMNSPSTVASGYLSSNAPYIVNRVDRVTITYDGTVSDASIASDLSAQLGILGNAYWKTLVQTRIGGSTCAELNAVHSFIISYALLGADAWRNFADITWPGGAYYTGASQLQHGCP